MRATILPAFHPCFVRFACIIQNNREITFFIYREIVISQRETLENLFDLGCGSYTVHRKWKNPKLKLLFNRFIEFYIEAEVNLFKFPELTDFIHRNSLNFEKNNDFLMKLTIL